jgi:RND family efflux transporter MFP subunit
MRIRASVLLVGLLVSLEAAAGSYEASIQFARRAELGTPVSGVVREVAAAAGEAVARGQVLVRLDEAPFRAAVAQSEAEVARATAAHSEAVRDHRQARELYDRTVLSTVELENAALRLDRAAAALKEARARQSQARWSAAQAQVAAPFDAWVLEVRTTTGAPVASALEARALIVLAARGEYLARARVPGAVLEALKIGQGATVAVGGRSYAGKIASLALEPSAKGGDYEIAVAFGAPDVRLHAGQPARVEIP